MEKLNKYIPKNGVISRIIHVVHGMTEHMGRYEALADACQALVIGYDLPGHGINKQADCAAFEKGQWEGCIKDVHQVYTQIKPQYKHLPYYVLGFSLGSFIVREYLSVYSEDQIDGAIWMGTGNQPGFILEIMQWIVNREIKKVGYDKTTPLVRKLSLENYNKSFKPNRTSMDWLCSDEKQLDLYLLDHLCCKEISAGLFYELLGSMNRVGKASLFETYNKDLPILVISGENDPVGDFTKGVISVKKKMHKAKMNNVQIALIKQGRHDLLHEEENGAKQETLKRIMQFMEGVENL